MEKNKLREIQNELLISEKPSIYLEKIKILKKGLKMRGTAIISLQNSL